MSEAEKVYCPDCGRTSSIATKVHCKVCGWERGIEENTQAPAMRVLLDEWVKDFEGLWAEDGHLAVDTKLYDKTKAFLEKAKEKL